MAAPASAYRDGKLNMGQPSDPKSHLIAILQTSKSVMLSRFYLDELVSVKLPNGTDGVVGAVIIGGDNEEMHNITTRGGAGRVMVSGQPARMLNDAGLNTFGLSRIDGTKKHHSNFIAVRLLGRASYYSLSSSWGLEFKKNSESWAEASKLDLGALSAGQEVPLQYYVLRYVYNLGDTLNIRSYHVNEEGTRYSDVVNVTLDLPPIIQQISAFVDGGSSPCSDPTEEPVVLMDNDTRTFLETFTSESNVNTGKYIYKGEPFNSPLDANGEFIPVPSGYYRGLDGVYSHVFFVSNTGEVLRRVVCVPVLPHLGYLSILPGFATPDNPAGNPELVYVVEDVIATTYTVFGYVVEYTGGIPQGSQKAFNLTVNANTSTVVWNTKPTLNKVAGGKFRLINVYIDPNNVGTITQTDEI